MKTAGEVLEALVRCLGVVMISHVNVEVHHASPNADRTRPPGHCPGHPRCLFQGQPAQPPWRLALVTLLQFAEGLSDRQAANAVRSRIDWKYALRLELTDPGFDASVLSEFRTRLITGEAESLLFDTLLTWCHALNTLAVVAPEWLRAVSHPDWRDRYMRRAEDDRLSTTQTARAALTLTIGNDGWQLHSAVDHPDAPPWLREVPAVAILRRVWIQNYRWDGTRLQWREANNIPPAARFISSPNDPDTHYARKHSTPWVGLQGAYYRNV
jgi:transposase